MAAQHAWRSAPGANRAPGSGWDDGGVLAIAELLTDLDDATAALLSDLDGLTDRDARHPSLRH